MKRHTLFLFLSFSSVTAACEMEGGGGNGGGGGGGSGGAASIAFSVRLVDPTAATETPLVGVEVCAAGHPEIACSTSDADGNVLLELPAGSELMLKCEGPLHGPMYMTWAIGTEDIAAGDFGILEKAKLGALVGFSGAMEWPAKGAVLANVYEDLVERDQRVAGATFAIVPAAGGPVYVSEGKLPDPSLQASTTGGPAVFFDEVDGEVTVTIAHPTRTCYGGFGWPTSSSLSLRSRVFPGGASTVTFVCPP
jgi:hypothetical protein